MPDADPQDLLLLDDLLGIADPEVPLPKIDPDARRRRLTALINAAQLARTAPALFVVEDVHWIDEVSESMLADFLSVIPQTTVDGADHLSPRISRSSDADRRRADDLAWSRWVIRNLNACWVNCSGRDPSVEDLADLIAGRAAGNPFFAEEIARELAERGVLVGRRGGYVCHVDAADVQRCLPTVQATVAARIDRLGRRGQTDACTRRRSSESRFDLASDWPRWASIRSSTSWSRPNSIDQVAVAPSA